MKTLNEILEQVIKDIRTLRDEVAQVHGTHKYDSCYDDCIEIIKGVIAKNE